MGQMRLPSAARGILPVLLVMYLLLTAGVVINVAVAWGWAAWGVPPHGDLGQWSVSAEVHPDDSPFWLMQGHGGMGASVVRVAPIHVRGLHAQPYQHLASSRPDVSEDVRRRFARPPSRDDQYARPIGHAFDERGWPLRCLRSENTYHHGGGRGEFIEDVHVVGGIQLWPEQTARGGWALQRVRALPLIPIWPAFIANSLLYAALTGVVCIGYPVMVRTLGVRRSLRLAIIAMLVAPLLVVAVACGIAAKHEMNQMPRIEAADSRLEGDERTPHLIMARQDRHGGTRLIFSAGRAGTDTDRMPRPPILGAAPAWSRSAVDEATAREWRGFDWRTHEAVGWPCRVLESSFDSHVTETLVTEVEVVRGSIIGTLPTGLDLDTPRTLRLWPTRIIWPGLLVNWTIYAFVIFGVMACPGVVRSRWRMRRGRCAQCGYDLRSGRTAGCPECGWTRRVATASGGVNAIS